MKYLDPMILTDSLYAPIEESINMIFERAIFGPLRAALAALGIEIRNAPSVGLERALTDGQVWYSESRIYGTFNASISKELKGMGATFDKRTKSWKLPGMLPPRLQMAIAHAESESQKAVEAVIRTLDTVNVQDAIDQSHLQEQYGAAAWRMNDNFLDAVKAITVAPKFTEEQNKIIAREWAQNLELYIKDWADEAILDLRQKVQANTLRGQRAGNLVKTIQETQGVSKTKAKFLARQETSLLMSKMRETRFKDIGVVKYVWTGTDDARERPDHKVLNGKVFTWDQPPITNRETGARNNPGEDFGCRCLAVPILEGV